MYLGIDLWDKRCWIAIYLHGIVMPKDIIDRVKIMGVLKKMIREYKIETIVVWLPYDLHGKKLRQLEKTQIFIGKLKKEYPKITIEGIDERFTSFEADEISRNWWNGEKRDDIAAALILESYITRKWKI